MQIQVTVIGELCLDLEFNFSLFCHFIVCLAGLPSNQFSLMEYFCTITITIRYACLIVFPSSRFWDSRFRISFVISLYAWLACPPKLLASTDVFHGICLKIMFLSISTLILSFFFSFGEKRNKSVRLTDWRNDIITMLMLVMIFSQSTANAEFQPQ